MPQTTDIFRLVGDPETTQTKTGTPVTRFRVAYNQRPRKDKGETEGQTWWISCSVFGAMGGIAQQYLKKGSQVMLAGSLEMEKYLSTKTNAEETGYTLNVQELTLVGSREENSSAPAAATAPVRTPVRTPVGAAKAAAPAFGEDDPF